MDVPASTDTLHLVYLDAETGAPLSLLEEAARHLGRSALPERRAQGDSLAVVAARHRANGSSINV